MRNKNISVHSLENGGENMNQVVYNKMKIALIEFGLVDMADFSVHYLREFLGDSPQLHDLQQAIDIKAVADMNERFTHWE